MVGRKGCCPMTKCRDCKEPIQFLPHPKTGKDTPYDDPLPPPPNHYQSKAHRDAKKESQNGQKPAKVAKSAKDSPERELAVAGLMALRYKVTEAKEMLKDVPEGEPDVMVRAALKRKGAE